MKRTVRYELTQDDLLHLANVRRLMTALGDVKIRVVPKISTHEEKIYNVLEITKLKNFCFALENGEIYVDENPHSSRKTSDVELNKPVEK